MMRDRRWNGQRLLALAVLALAACAGPRLGDSEADRVLEDLLSPGGGRLSAAAPPVARTEHRTRTESGVRVGDIYRASTPRAGIVLVPGLTRAGKDDRRVRALARTLARAGFLVYVPDLELRFLRVSSRDVAALADALTFLRRRPALPDAASAGFMAFSFATGPTLVAALGDGAGAQADFVVSVGGYFDLRALIAFVTTGDAALPDENGRVPDLPRPSDDSRWVIAASLAERLPDAQDRNAWRRRALAALASGGSATVGQALPGLGAGGRALQDLLANRDPSRVGSLIDALPEPLQVEIEALDPARRDLAGIRARLVAVHGRADPFIPYTQSVALVRAAPAGRAELLLVDGLAHVDLEPRSGDLPVLRRAINAVLDARQ